MIRPLALLLAGLFFVGPALAERAPECLAARDQLEHAFPLQRVAQAIAAKRLNVLVVGSGSSTLPGPDGVKKAYPAELQKALSKALPGVAVTVATDIEHRRTAAMMVDTLKKTLQTAKPALVIWQTGTVDAMRGIDADQFSAALEEGIALARAAGADIILINSQYSPRTESMIALGTYNDDLRWVALQHEVPLFDRFEIMRTWGDNGVFDFTGAADKLQVAARVHACIGWLLADLVTGAAQPEKPQTEGGR
jgi:hypothetical protein